MKTWIAFLLCLAAACLAQTKTPVPLPSGKMLISPAPGAPQMIGSFPVSVALSPEGRYLAILDNGYGQLEYAGRQGIGVLDLQNNRVAFYPDERLGQKARQTYFLGLAFSTDGTRLYASMASLTDPLAAMPGSTGNGIAVYRFDGGQVTPERFISLPPPQLPSAKRAARAMGRAPAGTAIPYPAGLAVMSSGGTEQLLVAENMADDVVQIDGASGKIVRRFDLSIGPEVPTSYPYTVVVNRAGTRAWCSLWNGSRVAELDLNKGQVARWIALHAPKSPTEAGSHPTALLLSPKEDVLYVALANTDEIAVVETQTGAVARYVSTRLPRQQFPGSYPIALGQTKDGDRLFVANAGSDAVAVFAAGGGHQIVASPALKVLGFIPTEWYPTAVAVLGEDLLIASGKSRGTGPNSQAPPPTSSRRHPYIASLLHGSVARVNVAAAEKELGTLTAEVAESNRMNGRTQTTRFKAGRNPIKHVIYVIKENRTYDQIFGDLGVGDGDPSLVMYGEAITPNQHKLARQFGVLDNFYDSGEISGNGHIWSTAAIVSDYTEKTWPITYRSAERTYDFEGLVSGENPLEQRIPDVDEPGSGFLWANAARHGISYRHYGEFIVTRWCDGSSVLATQGISLPPAEPCRRTVVNKGEPLPENVGEPRGSASPYNWPVPLPAHNEASKPELVGHFNPYFADFRVDYPDQLRADVFLDEFQQFVREREAGRDTLPQLIVLRLPADHTAGTKPGHPKPAASVADNDLALGRVVEAISHSAYWKDTAILVLEDDAQDGADHVDAHRSIALVISKYAPRAAQPVVDHHFYTTVNMIRTIEVLLGLPPMNNDDAHAGLMAPLFAGDGNQPEFTADYRNRDNGLIYEANPPGAPGAAASMQMDFSHADAVDSAVLNQILWREAKGDVPMPQPRHSVIPVR